MKRYIALILTFIMMISVCVIGYASPEPSEEQRITNQIAANEQYNMLLQGLEQKKISRSSTIDYYGGAYIDDDGNLVVCVTDDYATGSYEIQSYTENDDIQICRVRYTYDEIKQEQERITALYQEYANALKDENMTGDTVSESVELIVSSLRGTYIDEEKNALVVRIYELDEQKIAAFGEIFSSEEYIEFEMGYSSFSTSGTETKPGMRIYTASGESLSAGYPVYYRAPWGLQTLGFITAGHSFSEGDSVYRDANCTQTIGVCQESQFSGDMDAALIRIVNSSYAPSFTTNNNTVLIGYTTLAQGSYVYKEGSTTGLTYGTILSTSGSVYYEDNSVNLTNVYVTSALVYLGDSGGVAYDAGNRVIGSVSGVNGYFYEGGFAFIESYLCKYSVVAEAFNCSISG